MFYNKIYIKHIYMFQLINYYYFICLFFVDKILIFYVLRKIIY